MRPTKTFRKTVQARATRDVAFRAALFQEAVQALLEGGSEAGRAATRDYINATLGFEKLGEALGRSSKDLTRMFGASGDPTAYILFRVIGLLQIGTGVRLQVRAVQDTA